MENRFIDYIIIASYLLAVALIGKFSGGKQKSVKDYFLGAKHIPWWAVCFSIVAAETSALTFISVPGLAYLTNLNFLQVAVGFLVGRIIVAMLFLPAYFKGELETAYKFLDTRFGKSTRSFASVVFLLTRLAADGVRLFATSIPLYLMLQVNPIAAIILVALMSLIYTYTGGIKGVIWVDVIQMFIYLGGAAIAGIFLLNNFLPDGIDSVISAAQSADKLSIFDLGFEDGIAGFFAKPYTLLGGLLGGAFLSMASHGTDQLIVQRLLTTKDLKSARKAIVGSGVIVIFQFAIFLLVGVALYAYYGQLDLKSDEVFPKFIIEQLPVGISGIIIAGLFAAAMSTLAGSISSLSSSTMLDLYQPFKKTDDPKKELKISRMFSLMWAALLIGAAIFFQNSPQTVVELALSIASFTYGGLLGTFMLGLFVKNATQEDALAGFTSGIFVMITVISLNLVAWTWYTIIGVITTMAIGAFLSSLSKRSK